MNNYFFTLFLVLILSSIFANSCKSRRSSSLLITGGSEVNKNELFSQSSVALISDYAESGKFIQYCSGTLVAPNKVLTAAHCVNRLNGNSLFVFFGLNTPDNVNQKIVPQSLDAILSNPAAVEASGFVLPWSYLTGQSKMDIAILTLKNNAPKSYSPVSIAQPDLEISNSDKFVAAAFGKGGNGESPGILRKTSLTFSKYDERSGFFTLQGSDKGAVCNQDSGGSLYLVRDSETVLIGVVNRVHEIVMINEVEMGGNCKDKSEHLDLRRYRGWLKQFIKANIPSREQFPILRGNVIWQQLGSRSVKQDFVEMCISESLDEGEKISLNLMLKDSFYYTKNGDFSNTEENCKELSLSSSVPGIEGAVSLAPLALLASRNLLGNFFLYSGHVEYLSPLKNVFSLDSITFFNNKLKDLTPLSKLYNLANLELNSNQIVDLNPLSLLKGIKTLELRDNLIKDLSPLAGLENLRLLDLRGNPLEKGEKICPVPDPKGEICIFD